MSFLFPFFELVICFFSITWIDTKVDVPLDANITEYLDIPQAILYKDGKIVDHAMPVYKKTGVNRTFLSTVNTSYVKEYKIYFEVYFEAYDLRNQAQIIFNVIDDVKPMISYIPTYKIQVGQPLPDFKKYLVFSDNYDDKDLLIIDVDESKIIKNQVGTYPVTYTIRDTSQNSQSYEVFIDIIDSVPPVISLKKPMIVDVDSHFDHGLFINVTDNYDVFVDVIIQDEMVDYSHIGTYPITIIAKDTSNNMSQETFLISIVDQISPIIVLKTYPEPIEVFDEITDDLLKNYILSVEDNYDDLTVDDIKISHDIDHQRVGTYKIFYSVVDRSSNITNVSLNIEVVDSTKPIITIIKPFVFEVFSEPVSIYQHIEIEDNYCEIDDLKTTITTKYNLDIVGTYDVVIEVIDLYKNKATYRGIIEVVDLVGPDIIELTDIIITDFEPKDLSIFFRATDQYDQGDLEIIVDDHLVDYEKIGNYEITVYASDHSNNQSIITSSVIIIDISAPTLMLSHKEVHLSLGEDFPNLYDFVIEISDNYDILTTDDLVIISSIKMDTPGNYEVIYSLKDSSLNETIKTINIKIYDYEKPYIYAEPLYINMYENIDLLEGVVTSDNVGVKNIYYHPTYIDTSYPGTYEITYIVMDLSGNTSKFTRTIHIEKKDETYAIEAFIPLVIVTIFSVSLIYVLYKKL